MVAHFDVWKHGPLLFLRDNARGEILCYRCRNAVEYIGKTQSRGRVSSRTTVLREGALPSDEPTTQAQQRRHGMRFAVRPCPLWS